MSLFENFITEGNEKADELAKQGAVMDGGEMAQVRACGRSSKHMKMQGTCEGQGWLGKDSKHERKR